MFSRAERKFDLMQELGCDLLLVCSNVSPDVARRHRPRGSRLPRARRARRKARPARRLSRRSPGAATSTTTATPGRSCAARDHPAIGLVLDSFHALVRGTDLKSIRAIPQERIFLVQVADAPLLEMDFLSWSRHYRCFPGQGDLPIGDFMEALQATGFDGLLSLEIFNDRFRAGSARSVAVDGQRSLIFMLDELRRQTARRSPGSRTLPPRATLPGRRVCRVRDGRDRRRRLREALLRGSASPTRACTARRP